MLVRLTSRYAMVLGFVLLSNFKAYAAESDPSDIDVEPTLSAPKNAEEDEEEVDQDSAKSSKEKYTMVAIGDSITRAFNAELYFWDTPSASWTTGKQKHDGFDSHLERLQKLFPEKKVKAYNYARTGALMKDLARQVKKTIKKHPEYVTLLIGANDFCRWGADYQGKLDEFTQRLKTNLDTLIAADPKVKITMSAVPDIYNVWKVSKDKSSCQTIWNLIGFCKELLNKNLTGVQRLAFRDRWEHANSNMESVAAMYPQNVKFSGAVANYAFKVEDLSTHDCFHPSLKGQGILADVTWREGWFAGLENTTAQ